MGHLSKKKLILKNKKYSYSHPLVVVMIMMVILHLPGTIQTLCKLVIVEVGLLNDGNPRVIESF